MRRMLACAVLSLLAVPFPVAPPVGAATPRAHAVPTHPRPAVHLRSGEVTPGPDALRAYDLGAAGGDVVVVRFDGPPSAADLTRLAASVERIYTYLPDHAFLVRLAADDAGTAADLELLRSDLGAAWATPWLPAHKLAPEVATLGATETATSDRLRPVMLHVFPDADLAGLRGHLTALLGPDAVVGVGDAGSGARFARVRLLLPEARIAALGPSLANRPEVFWVGLEGRYELLNDTTVSVGQAGTPNGADTPIFDRGIHGEGQIIAVLDTGIDPDMCYFRDFTLGLPPVNACDGGTVVDLNQRKVIGVDFLWSGDCNGGISSTEWDNQDHGTHVAGTAAGDDLTNPIVHDAGDGMAPGAKLVIQDGGFQFDNCADLPALGCPVVDLNPIFRQAYDQGARIHTNSWGDRENFSPQNIYSAGSEDADQFMWAHKDFLLVFAAGNQGPGSGTVGSPATAKSVLAVGATGRNTSMESMASFSSCGLTDDGRIKPEVTVPGSSIVSANSDNNTGSFNCNTKSSSGTSMAAPGAAGFAALVRQYYADGFYPTGAADGADGFDPSAALVKATLMNSAAQMANAGSIPGLCQGWGRILLDDALAFTGESRGLYVEDDTVGFAPGSSGVERSFPLTVAAGEPLKVTLAWTDYPSTPAAATHLVNDLDLIVSGPDGVFLGNVFSGGVSVAGGAANRRDPVEQVLLANPTPGTWTVTVRAHTVPQGPQPFALVATGNLNDGGGGPCTTPPSFGGVVSAVDDQTASCGVTVSWNAASSNCSEFPDVTYSVYRSTTAGFTPGPSNRVATCLTGTSWVDGGVAFGTDYHYVARAEDSGGGGAGPCNGGNVDANTVTASAGPTGGRAVLHAVDFESGAGGWVHDAAGSTCSEGQWVVADPVRMTAGPVQTQPEDDHTAAGVNAFFTGVNTRNSGRGDVDDGVCAALSPMIDASAYADVRVSLWWFHGQKDAGDDAGDFFTVDLSTNGGSSWGTSMVSRGDATSDAAWAEAVVTVSNPGQLRLRAGAADGPANADTLEAGLDDILVEGVAACQ